MSLLKRIYNLTDFGLRCEGRTVDREDVQAWLRSDTPYFQSGSFTQGRYHLHVGGSTTTAHSSYFLIECWSNAQTRAHPDYGGRVRLLAQEVFCALERRGLRVIVVKSDWVWE
jgi:hypothetical protein